MGKHNKRVKELLDMAAELEVRIEKSEADTRRAEERWGHVYNAAMKQLQTYDEVVAVERQTRKRMKELEARQEAERNET